MIRESLTCVCVWGGGGGGVAMQVADLRYSRLVMTEKNVFLANVTFLI